MPVALKFTVVFFDFGGTLLKPRRDRILQVILSNQGIAVPLPRIHEAHHLADSWWEDLHGGTVFWQQEHKRAFNLFVLEKLGLAADRVLAERLATAIIKQWDKVQKTIEPELYPEVLQYLQRLRSRGYTLGLISNASPKDKEIVLSVGLDRYLNHIVISGIVGVAKPNPEIFHHALMLAAASADEAIHVGDSYKADVLGARSAGLGAVLIDRDNRYRDFDCPRIRTLDELESLLT